MAKALDLYDKQEFYACLQCAVCTGSCPAARVVPGYNPREFILRYILYGEQEEVLDNPLIWCCTTCHTCQERCPNGICITGLLTHILNMAAKRGNVPQALIAGVRTMVETGWSIPATPRSDRIRKELGLAPLKQPNHKEIREIFSEAGLDAILEIE